MFLNEKHGNYKNFNAHPKLNTPPLLVNFTSLPKAC